MADINELLAKAYGKASFNESAHKSEDNQFDELDTFITNATTNTIPTNMTINIAKDGNQLQIGDPVVGIHKGMRMTGQVLSLEPKDGTAVVEWRDKTKSRIKTSQLELSNVDDDVELETMYIESDETNSKEPYMGFDKESFTEDTDLECLLKGNANGDIVGGPDVL